MKKCKKCGECCGNLLPLSKREIEEIKLYIKEHNIQEQKTSFPMTNTAYELTCPFLDITKATDKCKIYEVRPQICRSFRCNEPASIINDKKLGMEKRKIINMRETFFK